MHLREEERAHRPAIGIEAFRRAPDPHEDFLHDFLGEHPIGEDPAGEREARSRVAAVELGERRLVAGRRPRLASV